ncbi:MAG: CPBP family intramembrane metalloprotease [Thermoplasmata archaeon]|nr:CPBP family intramembrane metalloprotease [Thermoplasmata archaeon]
MTGPLTTPLPHPRSDPAVVRYFVALVVTVLAILSQYFVPQLVPAVVPLYANLIGSLAVVYGIPVLAFGMLVGLDPLRRFAKQMPRAAWEGVRWYGLLSVLALAITIALAVVYAIVDPSALKLLERPNPVLTEAASNPWFWVGLSFFIGAVEETIFRGWIFGFWSRRPGASWVVHAFWTSAVFAGVHLYYGQTYGAASPLVYPTLFLLGFAFAATYHASSGNLVIVALLHGINDGSGFLTLVSPDAALAVHYGIVLLGFALAIFQWAFGSPWSPRPPSPTPLGPSGIDPRAPAFFPPPPPPDRPLPPPPPPTQLVRVRHSLEPSRSGSLDGGRRCRDARGPRLGPDDRRRGVVG